MSELQNRVLRLIAESTASWETARKNYAALRNISRKTIYFNDFRMEVQFNPDRMRSTTAPLDPGPRPCFLCAANRPPEQRAERWRGYEVLVNPFPIFDPHLVVATAEHVPQFLTGRIGELLDLAAELPGFVLSFNGARAGASAPDHFHFQAVKKEELPSVTELPAWENRHALYHHDGVSVWAAEGYLRPAIVVEGAASDGAATAAGQVLAALTKSLREPDEAQVNALAWWESGRYTVVLFPRTAHRPREYEAADGTQFLFSPGAAELAGVVVTVRPEDFERADAPLLTRLFSQVVPDAILWESIKKDISRWLVSNPK